MRAFFISELGLHRGYVSGKSTAMSTQSSSSAGVAQVDAKLGHQLALQRPIRISLLRLTIYRAGREESLGCGEKQFS